MGFFRVRHEPLISNMMFDDPGDISRQEFDELVGEFADRHPDEAITNEVINELLKDWYQAHGQSADSEDEAVVETIGDGVDCAQG